jgi:hypothetical protein
LFDPEPPVITHATTRQTLRFRGAVANKEQLGLTDSGNRRWIRFDYEDEETRYPVLVEWRNVPIPASGRPLVWRVDHIRSAALWCIETGSSSAIPSYGLWRRVDDCLTDALRYLPSNRLMGRKPAVIALNGGWLNGEWTPEFYRRVWGSMRLVSSTEAFETLVPRALNTEAPAPWRRVEPALDMPPFAGELPDEIRAEIGAAIERGPYLQSEDGHRVLLVLPPREQIESPSDRKCRLFYADREFATDALRVSIDVHHGLPTLLVQSGRSYLLFDFTTGQRLPRVPHASTLPGGLVVQGESPPHWVSRRLARACLDGLLSYPDMEWAPTVRLGSGAAVSLPKQVYVSTSHSSVEAVRSLADSPRGQRNSLTEMFDEANDGIVRNPSPFITIGFWTFDPLGVRLINTLNEQRVVYRGELDGVARASVGERAWEFRYEDRDTQYPLVVISRPIGTESHLRYVWLIDHPRSAGLWQARTQGASPPPYGLWRRVDDCMMDALLCWPEIEATGPVPNEVVGQGGWLNGAWSPNFRHLRRRPGFGFADEHPVPPFLEDLHASPLSWHYIDTAHVARGADLAGVQQLAPGRYYLPSEERLTGFERDMPHLRRGDGQAVMFPAGLKSKLWRAEDYHPGAFFLYADADVFFQIDGQALPGVSNIPPGWKFETSDLTRMGLRHADRFDSQIPSGLPDNWFRQGQKWAGGRMCEIPSPRLWQRLRVALMDGWLAWTGTANRLLDDPDKLARLRGGRFASVPPQEKSGIDLARKPVVHVDGAYIGGHFDGTCASRAWLET